MNPEQFLLNDYDSIKSLPDGSLISWLRVAGDESSEAAAFVRHEGEDTWLSPGGWDPLPISAVDLPAQIIRFGAVGSAFAPPGARFYSVVANGEEIGHAEAVIAREYAEDNGLPWDENRVHVIGGYAADDGDTQPAEAEDAPVEAAVNFAPLIDQRRHEALRLGVEFARDRGATTDIHPGTEAVVKAATTFYAFLTGEDTK